MDQRNILASARDGGAGGPGGAEVEYLRARVGSKIQGPFVVARDASYARVTSDWKRLRTSLTALGGAAKDDFVAHCVLDRYMRS